MKLEWEQSSLVKWIKGLVQNSKELIKYIKEEAWWVLTDQDDHAGLNRKVYNNDNSSSCISDVKKKNRGEISLSLPLISKIW